jgi:hypothetical protein
MEQALAASEDRLQKIFAQAPLGVAVLRGREMVFELVIPFIRRSSPDASFSTGHCSTLCPR